MRSVFSDEKKLSIAALSHTLPERLIEQTTPFSDQQIAFALQQAETGTSVADICRKLGISEATFYRWKERYGGLMPSEVRKLKHLEEENVRLRRLVSDLSLDKEMLQEVLRKKV